jgi:hypothetical protein
MTTTTDRITQLEHLKTHLQRFIEDKGFRDELGRSFKGFAVAPEDFLALEAVTEYLGMLKQSEAAK